jgi:hypothetical protein
LENQCHRNVNAPIEDDWHKIDPKPELPVTKRYKLFTKVDEHFKTFHLPNMTRISPEGIAIAVVVLNPSRLEFRTDESIV